MTTSTEQPRVRFHWHGTCEVKDDMQPCRSLDENDWCSFCGMGPIEERF